MITSPKCYLFSILFLLPLFFFAQEKPGDYYDINKALYKRITSTKEGPQTTYFNTAGNPITNICKPDNREYVRFADIQNAIFRLLSEKLKDDTTRLKRSVDFCFAVSDKGVSNVRVISYELNYTKEEIQQFLENLLTEIDLKAATPCTLIVEIPYWDYMLDPVSKEKK